MIQDDVDDLQIVKGGWQDARKGDAFEEVKHMFSIIEHPDCCTDMWAPASRTKFYQGHTCIPRSSCSYFNTSLLPDAYKAKVRLACGRLRTRAPRNGRELGHAYSRKCSFRVFRHTRDEAFLSPRSYGRVGFSSEKLRFCFTWKGVMRRTATVICPIVEETIWSGLPNGNGRDAATLQECYAAHGGSTTRT